MYFARVGLPFRVCLQQLADAGVLQSTPLQLKAETAEGGRAQAMQLSAKNNERLAQENHRGVPR